MIASVPDETPASREAPGFFVVRLDGVTLGR